MSETITIYSAKKIITMNSYQLAATHVAVREGRIPPTINYENPDPDCALDYVPNESRDLEIQYALNNGFGFGGTNGSLLLKHCQN